MKAFALVAAALALAATASAQAPAASPVPSSPATGEWKAGEPPAEMATYCPLTDGGTIRGLCVFKAASLEEARAFEEADPAVKAGRLTVEVHPWMVQKGILP